MVYGECLCGSVKFKASGSSTDIYQCHCSICQKVSGSNGISCFETDGEGFVWLSGKELVKLFVTESGYRVPRCSNCGSPLPDSNPDKTLYWIPAGLITQDLQKKVFAHIFTGSKPGWHKIGDAGIQYERHFPHREKT